MLVRSWEQVCVDSGKYESLHNSLPGRVVRLAYMKLESLEHLMCFFNVILSTTVSFLEDTILLLCFPFFSFCVHFNCSHVCYVFNVI